MSFHSTPSRHESIYKNWTINFESFVLYTQYPIDIICILFLLQVYPKIPNHLCLSRFAFKIDPKRLITNYHNSIILLFHVVMYKNSMLFLR